MIKYVLKTSGLCVYCHERHFLRP